MGAVLLVVAEQRRLIELSRKYVCVCVFMYALYEILTLGECRSP